MPSQVAAKYKPDSSPSAPPAVLCLEVAVVALAAAARSHSRRAAARTRPLRFDGWKCASAASPGLLLVDNGCSRILDNDVGEAQGSRLLKRHPGAGLRLLAGPAQFTRGSRRGWNEYEFACRLHRRIRCTARNKQHCEEKERFISHTLDRSCQTGRSKMPVVACRPRSRDTACSPRYPGPKAR